MSRGEWVSEGLFSYFYLASVIPTLTLNEINHYSQSCKHEYRKQTLLVGLFIRRTQLIRLLRAQNSASEELRMKQLNV
jgi:hypothetical protein